MYRLLKSLFVVGALFVAPGLAEAREYKQEVQLKLLAAGVVYFDRGFQLATDPYYDRLRAEQWDSLDLYMNSGSYYHIIGACDDDCSDLDLILYDENNNEISRDTKTDGVPIVEVNPRWSGNFTLRVRMYRCNVNPCHYGVMMMKR